MFTLLFLFRSCLTRVLSCPLGTANSYFMSHMVIASISTVLFQVVEVNTQQMAQVATVSRSQMLSLPVQHQAFRAFLGLASAPGSSAVEKLYGSAGAGRGKLVEEASRLLRRHLSHDETTFLEGFSGPVTVLDGPPGSGKTDMMLFLAAYTSMLETDNLVVVAADTKRVSTDLLKRLQKMLAPREDHRWVRLGANEDSSSWEDASHWDAYISRRLRGNLIQFWEVMSTIDNWLEQIYSWPRCEQWRRSRHHALWYVHSLREQFLHAYLYPAEVQHEEAAINDIRGICVTTSFLRKVLQNTEASDRADKDVITRLRARKLCTLFVDEAENEPALLMACALLRFDAACLVGDISQTPRYYKGVSKSLNPLETKFDSLTDPLRVHMSLDFLSSSNVPTYRMTQTYRYSEEVLSLLRDTGLEEGLDNVRSRASHQTQIFPVTVEPLLDAQTNDYWETVWSNTLLAAYLFVLEQEVARQAADGHASPDVIVIGFCADLVDVLRAVTTARGCYDVRCVTASSARGQQARASILVAPKLHPHDDHMNGAIVLDPATMKISLTRAIGRQYVLLERMPSLDRLPWRQRSRYLRQLRWQKLQAHLDGLLSGMQLAYWFDYSSFYKYQMPAVFTRRDRPDAFREWTGWLLQGIWKFLADFRAQMLLGCPRLGRAGVV